MLAFSLLLAARRCRTNAELSSRLQARGAQACRPTPPHVAPLISGRHQPSPVPLGPGAPSRLHCPNMSPQRAPRTEPCWPGRTRTAPLRRAVRVPREDEHTNCMTDPGRDRPAPGPPAAVRLRETQTRNPRARRGAHHTRPADRSSVFTSPTIRSTTFRIQNTPRRGLRPGRGYPLTAHGLARCGLAVRVKKRRDVAKSMVATLTVGKSPNPTGHTYHLVDLTNERDALRGES